LSAQKGARRSITISSIADVEDNPASVAVVNALVSRIEGVVKEMGLSASITVGAGNHQGNGQSARAGFAPRSVKGEVA